MTDFSLSLTKVGLGKVGDNCPPLKFKGGEIMKRVLGRMLGGQANLLCQAVFARWRDDLANVRKGRGPWT